MITVTYTMEGVEYSRNGNTVSFSGEQEAGEVHLNGDFVGYYERDNDTDVVQIVAPSEVLLAAFDGNSEEAFEAFAATLL